MIEDATDLIAVDQVLGSGPFVEVGRARVAVQDPNSGLLAVGGSPGSLQWVGHDVQSRSRPAPGWCRVGIYEPEALRCTHLISLSWPVNTLAFHPSAPLLAIGSGSYDGGYMFEGELTILDLESGRPVSVLDEYRDVGQLRWLDSDRLAAILAARSDDEVQRVGRSGERVEFSISDWSSLSERSVGVEGFNREPADYSSDAEETGDAETVLSGWASRAGQQRDQRDHVWAVEALADGRILAALNRVTAECWDTTGTRLWSVTTDGVGCQILVDPEQQTAATNTWFGTWTDSRMVIERLSITDGTADLLSDRDGRAVLTDDLAGRIAIRSASGSDGSVVVLSPSGDLIEEAGLGGYDLFNHFFRVRHAPDLLFLDGYGTRPHEDKWVVRVHTDRHVVERLFSLEWDPELCRHIYGGPGVFITGVDEDTIVHACAIHDSRGLLPGNSCIVRRSYPDGRMQWVHTADNQVTGLDLIGATIFATYNSGEMIALDARTGRVMGRQILQVDGHRVIPISLSTRPPGIVAVGTMDGRIISGSTALRMV